MKESQEPSVLTKTAPSSKKPPMSRKKKIILWTIIGVLVVAIAVTVPLVVVSRNNKKENEQSMADSMFHSVYQTAEQDGVYVKPAGNGKYKIYNSNGSFEKDFTGNAHLALSPNKKEHTYYFENGILDTTKEVTVVKVNGEDFYHYHGQLIESDAMELHGNLYWVYGGQIQYDKSGDFRISESDNTVYKVIKGKIVGYYESDGTLVGPGE